MDNFAKLDAAERKPFIEETASRRGSTITAVGKDFWVCWCFRQLDLAPFDRFIWPHLLVNPLSAPGRSEALRRPEGDAFRA
jgi:hypothetical protein